MNDAAGDHCGRRLDALWQCALYRRSLRLGCRRCPHQGLIDARPLWWLFKRRGWAEGLRDVPARLYCGRCWAERGARVRGPRLAVSLDAAPPCGLPDPNVREWRRMVSRYRG